MLLESNDVCAHRRVLPVGMLLERMARDGIDILDASNMQLMSTNLRPIAEMCSSMGHLRVLDVSNNNLKEEGGIILGESMAGHLRRLVSLNLSNNGFKRSGVCLAVAVRGMHTLQTLNMSKNGFDDEMLKTLAANLTTKSKSMSLDLSYNSFTDEGVFKLVPTRLTSLDLSWNLVGPAGAVHLAKNLKQSSKIEQLDLSYNKIGDEGCAAVVTCALSCPKISVMKVKSNGVTHITGYLIAQALPHFRTIVKLDISDNLLTRGVVNCLLHALNDHHNRHHTYLGRQQSTKAMESHRLALPPTEPEIIGELDLTSTFMTTPTQDVPNIYSKKYMLDLSSGLQHLLGEVVRHRILANEVKVVTGFVDGKHFSPKHKLPWEGTLILHLDQNEKYSKKHQDKLPLHHGDLHLKLDLSNSTHKKLAIAHLVSHHENKMTVDPKNMGKSAMLDAAPTQAEEFNFTCKNIKYNNREFPVNKEWLNMVNSGYVTYDLHESSLHLFGMMKLDLSSGRHEVVSVLRRVMNESSELEYVGKCKLNGEVSAASLEVSSCEMMRD